MPSTPWEIETAEELAERLAGRSLAGQTVQGLVISDDLSGIDLTDTVFIGCRFADQATAAALVRRGAFVVPAILNVPYPTHPARLYSPEDLTAGFADGGFAGMFDTHVYQHFVAQGGAAPTIREALAQRLHDHGIDNALQDALAAFPPRQVIGIMGGHAAHRGTEPYRLAAAIGQGLARAGRLVVTGGGPGVMEAANLGSYLAGHDAAMLTAAIDQLSLAQDFRDHDPYTAAALRVRRDHPPADGWAGGLAIPTWLYGHEPANVFASHIGKYFSNAIREDVILRAARGGIVFAPGRAGTVQEVFQAATKTYYATDGESGPFVFLDRAYWTTELPVAALLKTLLGGVKLAELVHITDDVDEALSVLTAERPSA